MLRKTFVFFTFCALALTLCAQGQKKGAYGEILGGDAEKAKQKPQYSYLYNTTLIKAIGDNDVDRINILLYAGVDPNEKNDEGTAPLVAAAGPETDAAITEMLLKHEAKVNEPSKNSITPLMEAAKNGRLDIVNILLEYGANPNLEDKNGKTALNYAAENKHHSIVLKLLDTQVIKINDKETALAASITSAAGAKDLVTVKRLMARGADINSKNNFGYTPLMAAVDTGDFKFVKDILTLNPGLEVKDNTGRTALMHAVQNGDNSIVKLLLTEGANPQTQDMLATTPIILAAKNNNNTLVKELLKIGANINDQDKLGRSALSWTVENGDYPVFNTVINVAYADANLSYGAENSTPLIAAAKRGDYKMTYDLLKKGAEPNAWDNEENTALYYAVNGNYTKVAALLVSYGANPLIKNEEAPSLTSIARANDNTKLAAILDTEEKRYAQEEDLRKAYKEQMQLRKQTEEERFWNNIEDIDEYIAFLENQMAKAKIVKAEREAKAAKQNK
ncbi:MAG: ankyrin repeat domain-containing protein [Elusimicrobia bacterium]|nr:ankyrin repeat domain-containing protein [Elusimicrobiota bacterium]